MLTWRSMANRVWHWHFGRGLSESMNDFGRMGTPPSHPELLDWLACELRDNGGSLKALHRVIANGPANCPAGEHVEDDYQEDEPDGHRRSVVSATQTRTAAGALKLPSRRLGAIGSLDGTRNVTPEGLDRILRIPRHGAATFAAEDRLQDAPSR